MRQYLDESALKNGFSRDAVGARKTKLKRAICRYIWLHVLSLDLKQIKQKACELFFSNLNKGIKSQNAILYSFMTDRVLSIMPNPPVRDQWEYPRKMERHFLIKPGQPIAMARANFYSFSEFPN